MSFLGNILLAGFDIAEGFVAAGALGVIGTVRVIQGLLWATFG